MPADAGLTHAVIESRLAVRSATPTGTVMTFETTRMRTVSAELRTSILQRMRAMPTGIRTVGVTQSPTAANARLKRVMVR